MHIPQRLAYILERDQELDGAVKLSIAQLEPWINNSNLPFFPEYTKHDLSHIEAVLKTAISLIRDEAWESITPSDAAVLVLAVLLHDIAMHLQEDGFIALLELGTSQQCIPGMGDKPWNLLWEDFCSEASRFDGRTLMRLFGETLPIRRPSLDPKLMTMKDRLLIGEFVRRHHPRLAQEIAWFGVPAIGNKPLAFQGLSESKNYISQLSGVIARSHGADVRSFIPYLRDHFDIRQYKGIHAVFLMTLLRVADYVQIDAERAPAQVLQVKRLASPVSQGEWKAHHAIRDIRHTHEDPEALFIDALPEDAQTFFRVQSWIKGIQQELDYSWAVLGEVYGRYEGLNKLGLVLRRIRSTLDNVEGLSEKLPYLPIKASFRGSDADLLKLLIEPLYGNRPEIGLRELVQNSVDAVRELKQYMQDVPSLGEVTLTAQESDVVVSIDTNAPGDSWVSIADKGIGMTPQIVVDYFLTAGASFRRSEDWKKVFETGDGKSKVLRAGRFGVGALAAFLLGRELYVSTRHIDESEGVEFSASVETELIELKRVHRPIGTTIRIRIPDKLVGRLLNSINWDWYCLAKPSVKRRVNGRELPQQHTLPGSGRTLSTKWRRIVHSDYEDIHWTYAPIPELVCNGLRVRHHRYPESPDSKWAQRYGLRQPNISVFDPDGRLPLNLQRTALAEPQYPFDEALATDVIRDFIAFSLVRGPERILNYDSSLTYEGSAAAVYRPAYSGISTPRLPWYFTQAGFGFLDAFILQNEGYESLLISHLDTNLPMILQEFHSGPKIFTGASNYTSSYSETEKWLRRMIEYGAYAEGLPITYPGILATNWSVGGEDVLLSMKRKGIRILISISAWCRIVDSANSKIRKRFLNLPREEWNENGWVLFTLRNCPEATFDFKTFANTTEPSDHWIITEVYLDQAKAINPSPIAHHWLQILKSAEVPFDVTQRQQIFKHVYAELTPNIRAHEAIVNQRLGRIQGQSQGQT